MNPTLFLYIKAWYDILRSKSSLPHLLYLFLVAALHGPEVIAFNFQLEICFKMLFLMSNQHLARTLKLCDWVKRKCKCSLSKSITSSSFQMWTASQLYLIQCGWVHTTCLIRSVKDHMAAFAQLCVNFG